MLIESTTGTHIMDKIAILDSSVIFFAINHKLESKGIDPAYHRPLIKLCLTWVNSLAWVPNLMGTKVIWVEDHGPYWRKDYYPEYKDNRKSKPELYQLILECFREMKTRQELRSISFPTYEADDVAAAIVRMFQPANNNSLSQKVCHTYLITVDSDWMGMVSDCVTWINTALYEPRIRKIEQCYLWVEGKYRKQSKKKQRLCQLPEFKNFNPTFIWEWKSATGDKADNIKASASHLIGLFNPPKVNDILESKRQKTELIDFLNYILLLPAKRLSNREANDLYQAICSFGIEAPIPALVYPMEHVTNEVR